MSDLQERLDAAMSALDRMTDQRDQLAAKLKDSTAQCGVMAELLRELRDGIEGEWCVPDDLDERIDAALAGKLPEPAMPEGWKLVEKANCFVLINEGQVIASMAGPTAEETASILSSVLDGHVPNPVPEGWKLVPVDPTKEMWDAVNKLDDAMYAGGDHHGASIEQCWSCLLAAAPKPEG